MVAATQEHSQERRAAGTIRNQLIRLAPLTGLVFVVLFLVAIFATPSTPNSDASTEKVVTFFTAHRTGQMVTAFLFWYAVLFALFFATALRSYLRAHEGSDGLLMLGFVGMALFVISLAILAGLLYSAADVPSKITPAAEQALNVLQDDLFPPLLIGLAAFMFGNGLAIIQMKALPKWLGWVAILLGLGALVPPISWFAILGLPAWILIVSVLVYLRQGRPTVSVETHPASAS